MHTATVIDLGAGGWFEKSANARAATPVCRIPSKLSITLGPVFSFGGFHLGKKPPLKLVKPTPATWPAPSRTLGNHGRSLWDRIMSEYDIQDSGGLEMLLQACAALDRAESLREQIDQDGEVIRLRSMVRDHPALKHELANRAFVVRTLAKLGLNFEAIRPSVGRPPQPMGWQP